MKRIIPEYSFTREQLNTIAALAEETGLSEQIVKILYARGIDTPEKTARFMHPSRRNFLSPFLMRGMKEAIETITLARDEGKTVAVFGDYDADGVCASAIMYHALKEFGIDAHVYIPERTDGYGLSEEAVDRVFEDCQPELFITVDCGISCAKEVQYIYELGTDVIVTDHHELPEVLPDCVTVNPKFEDDYPYDNLCGAGVAFKVACALLGERAYKLLDLVALATVADSVPLLGENRDIVTEGLKKINEEPRLCFSALLGKSHEDVTAQTLAFTIAPRINAAGRMGNARAAFELFVSDSDARTIELATELCSYNIERQKCCDELYLSAKKMIAEKGARGRVLMLYSEEWNAGFVGIVAAKFAEEYNRPTLLFVKNGDMLKGSARSIESVNIFLALKNCSEYIEEFGGHSQAAGVNVRADKFEALERALNEELERSCDAADFEKKIVVSAELEGKIDEKFAHELEKLEPYGVGHRRPLFSMNATACEVKPVKQNSPHLSVRSGGTDFMYFSGARMKKILECDAEKKLVFEVNLSRFKGREYIKGFIRDVVYDGKTGRETSRAIFANALLRLKSENVAQAKPMSTREMQAFIEERNNACPYGMCLIASDRRTPSRYSGLEKFGCDLFFPSARDASNVLIVSPTPNADLSDYSDFVFLDTPSDFSLSCLKGKNVFYNPDVCGFTPFLRLDFSRETLLSVYASLRKSEGSLAGENALELLSSCGGFGFDALEFLFAIVVFEELGLISFDGGSFSLCRGAKADLFDSIVYRKAMSLQENKEVTR